MSLNIQTIHLKHYFDYYTFNNFIKGLTTFRKMPVKTEAIIEFPDPPEFYS